VIETRGVFVCMPLLQTLEACVPRVQVCPARASLEVEIRPMHMHGGRHDHANRDPCSVRHRPIEHKCYCSE